MGNSFSQIGHYMIEKSSLPRLGGKNGAILYKRAVMIYHPEPIFPRLRIDFYVYLWAPY